MKTMKYILMIAIVSVMSMTYASAQPMQSMAEQPQAEMRSTSAMPGIGSTLPQAAVTGVYTSEQKNAATAPSRPRRVGEHDGDDEIPFPDPLGDALWPLLILAAAYALLRVYKRKRSV